MSVVGYYLLVFTFVTFITGLSFPRTGNFMRVIGCTAVLIAFLGCLVALNLLMTGVGTEFELALIQLKAFFLYCLPTCGFLLGVKVRKKLGRKNHGSHQTPTAYRRTL